MANKSVFTNSSFLYSNDTQFFAYGGLFTAPVQRLSVDALDENYIYGTVRVDALGEYEINAWVNNVDALDENFIHVGYFNVDGLDEYEVEGLIKKIDALDEYIIDAAYRTFSYTSIPPGIRRGYRARSTKHDRTFRVKRGYVNS